MSPAYRSLSRPELLTVEADATLLSAGQIEQEVTALGYVPSNVTRGASAAGSAGSASSTRIESIREETPWWSNGKAKITAAAGLALLAAYALSLVWPDRAFWVFVAATAIAAIPIGRRAFAAARGGSPFSIEMLMVIAATGAVVIDAAEEAAVVVFLFLIGELLEGYAAGRARTSIRALANIVPKTALVEEGSEVREVDLTALTVGQRIRVRLGDRIAADGKIVAGASSSIDEAPTTGQSMPKAKGEGESRFCRQHQRRRRAVGSRRADVGG